ncbi:MAG: chain length-determining protein, partial [Zoogloea sp.]|nr:chain length-determining protein [Zoogloea sp.]
MWLRRWLGLGVAWVVGVLAAGAILFVPDKYEASARIYADTQSMLKPLMAGLAVQPNEDQQIGVLSRTLISRPNMEKLVRMAGLDAGLKSRDELERTIDHLMKTVEIKTGGRDNLYTLAYQDREQERARRVVQALISIFVDASLGDKRKDTDSARQFIEEQIKVYEKKLAEAENRLKDFKLRNLKYEAGGGKDSFAQMSEVGSTLWQAKLQLMEAENSRNALRRQIQGEDPVMLADTPDAASRVPLPEIDGRLDAMKRSLDGLRQKYTDLHPDVIGVKRVIQELEEQKRRDVAARRRAGGTRSETLVNANPVYQQLKVALGEAEANVASLRTRVAEYEARYGRLRGTLEMTPKIEAELAQLNRDYDINKKNYESLVARRESAAISGQMDATPGAVDFRLIDPPRVSPQPVGPKRILLLPAALVLA